MNITEICNKAQSLYERLETESPDHFEEIQPDLQDVLDFISNVATKLQVFKTDMEESFSTHDTEEVDNIDFESLEHDIYDNSRARTLEWVLRELGGAK